MVLRFRNVRFFLGGLILFLPFQFASAQTTEPAQAPDPFCQNTWTLDLNTDYISGIPARYHIQLVGESVGFSYYFLDRLAFSADIPIYYIDQRAAPDAFASGLEAFFRWHFAEFDKWSLYADLGAGVLIGDNRFPPGGTNCNFDPQTGLGATYQLTQNLFLNAGARLFHISNAGLDNSDRNPALEYSVEGYAGVLFKF